MKAGFILISMIVLWQEVLGGVTVKNLQSKQDQEVDGLEVLSKTLIKGECAHVPTQLKENMRSVHTKACITFYADSSCTKPTLSISPGGRIAIESYMNPVGLNFMQVCRRKKRGRRIDPTPIIKFFTKYNHVIGAYKEKESCGCNVLNYTVGKFPYSVSNEGICLEMYADDECEGLVRKVEADDRLAADDLTTDRKIKKNRKGRDVLVNVGDFKPIKAFKLCDQPQNCDR